MALARSNLARSRAARSALLWASACFVFGQMALLLAIQHWHPELRDLEFGWKIVRLRQRLAQEPHKPAVLMFGSSRTAYGFQATRFDRAMAERGMPVVSFNLGVSNAGPVRENLGLRHILHDGRKPALVLIEVFPSMLKESFEGLEPLILSARDTSWLGEYCGHPRRLFHDWLQLQWAPGYSYRFQVLGRLARKWLPTDRFNLPDFLRRMDPSGWSRPQPHLGLSAAMRQQAVRRLNDCHGKLLLDYRIGSKPRRALTDMLALCRQENSAVLLVLMPEASELRSWYTPEAEARLQELLADMKQSFDLDHVDARTWIPDDCMWDSYHLLIPGSTLFTDRLAEEVARRVERLR